MSNAARTMTYERPPTLAPLRAEATAGRTPSILCVDVAVSGSRAAEALGESFALTTTATAAEAVAAAEMLGPFTVVVADWRMGDVEGPRFLAELRAASPESACVLLVEPDDFAAAVQHLPAPGQVLRTLAKPCTPQALRAAVVDAASEVARADAGAPAGRGRRRIFGQWTDARQPSPRLVSLAPVGDREVERRPSLLPSGAAEPCRTDLRQVAEDVVAVLRAGGRGECMDIALDPDSVEAPVRLNRAEAEHLLFTLLRHAIDALAKVPPESPRVSISVRRDDRAGTAVCRVTNNASTPAATDRGDAVATLGLGVARRMAEGAGGHLTFERVTPTQTTASVVLPAVNASLFGARMGV